jgi:hypothetical protein
MLRIPSDWVQATMRCKHCQLLVQARIRSPKAAYAAPVITSSPAGSGQEQPLLQGEFRMSASAAVAELPSASSLSFQQGSLDAGQPIITIKRPSRGLGWQGNLILLAFLALIAGIGYVNRERLAQSWRQLRADLPGPAGQGNNESEDPDSKDGEHPKPREGPKAAVPAQIQFPRRILAVSVNNYLYANPVSSGSSDDDLAVPPDDTFKRPDRSFHAILTRFAEVMHVPPGQVVELSDAAPRGQSQPPLKGVIEKTVAQFLDSCRAQDRIMVFFIGHAVEIAGANYLVPVEGELGVKETLIPVAWLMDRLGKCRAQEKILVMDVCRFNPGRGLERPGTGPMTATLEAALKNPPAGVRVWSACSAGQYSYEGAIELGDRTLDNNGYFINELFESIGPFKKRVNAGIQNAEDPFPLEVLASGDGRAKGIHASATFEVGDWYQQKQVPFLSADPADKARIVASLTQALTLPATGTPADGLPGLACLLEPRQAVPYDPKEPLAAEMVIQPPDPPEGGAANSALVQQILNEIDSKMQREGTLSLKVSTLPPFSAPRLAEYIDDGTMTPLRQVIVTTATLLKKHAETFKENFRGNGNDAALKKLILERQQKPARAFAELMDQLEQLKEVGDTDRKKEKSKRWLANYDFVLARLEARLAYVYEYNYMLGQIRKDALPPRDPAKHTGWRLAAQERLQSGSEAKKLATDSKKLLNKIAADHQGTPWEILAKRQALTTLGLEWQPTP